MGFHKMGIPWPRNPGPGRAQHAAAAARSAEHGAKTAAQCRQGHPHLCPVQGPQRWGTEAHITGTAACPVARGLLKAGAHVRQSRPPEKFVP